VLLFVTRFSFRAGALRVLPLGNREGFCGGGMPLAFCPLFRALIRVIARRPPRADDVAISRHEQKARTPGVPVTCPEIASSLSAKRTTVLAMTPCWGGVVSGPVRLRWRDAAGILPSFPGPHSSHREETAKGGRRGDLKTRTEGSNARSTRNVS
jgi:hypothetical protein